MGSNTTALGLGVAGITTIAWVLPANGDIASENDRVACQVCPITAMLMKLGRIPAYDGTYKHPWREYAEDDVFQFVLSHGGGNDDANPWRSFCDALTELAKETGDSKAIATLEELLGQLPEPAPLERITLTADIEMLFGSGPSPLEQVRTSLEGRVIHNADGLPIAKLTEVSVTKTPPCTSAS